MPSVKTTTRPKECQDVSQSRQNFFHARAAKTGESRFRSGGILSRINKLPNFGALLVQVGEVLFAEPLIDLKLLLGAILFSGADISLAKTIVSVSKIGIELEGARILRDGLGVFILVGVEIAQLQVRFPKFGIERQRFAEQGFDLAKIQAGILGALALP